MEEVFDQEVEAVDAAVDAAVEELTEKSADDKKEEDKKIDSDGDSDDEDDGGDVQETTFDNPSPEEIKQLQAEPKKLSDKKKE